MGEETLRTTNLLFAAVLLTNGAEVISINTGARFSEIILDTSLLSRDQLAGKFLKLSIAIKHPEENPDLQNIFNSSILGDIEDKYLRLKRAVVEKRGNGKV